jgi:CRISPR/Cas system-associated exonuclease Cas4 (RecB family)
MVYEKLSKEHQELIGKIEGAFADEKKITEVKKTGFSASGLFYSSGMCPRKWQLLFDGVESEDEWPHKNLRAVNSGSSSHEYLQEKLKEAIPELEIEKEFWREDPKMHGFVDAYHPGLNIPIEIKTTRAEAYKHREENMNATGYHENQLLVYCKQFKSELGLFIYEDRNSFDFVVVPLVVDKAKKHRINAIFEWMREIERVHAEGDRIKVFASRRANSKICSDCPIKAACDAAPEGTVDLPLLNKIGSEK